MTDPSAANPKRFPTGTYMLLLLLIVIAACLPIIAFVAAIVMIPMFGCTRGIVSYTCTGGGEGMASLVGNLELSLWLFVVTAPIGLFLFTIWLAVFLIHRLNFAGRRKSSA